MTNDEFNKRFDHHAPDAHKILEHQALRELTKELGKHFEAALPESREKALAFTALEEALMWGNAAIARN